MLAICTASGRRGIVRNKAKGDKGQGRRDKGQAGEGKRNRRARGRGKDTPAILLSYEDWNEQAMRDFLHEAVKEAEALLDEQEQALRSEN